MCPDGNPEGFTQVSSDWTILGHSPEAIEVAADSMQCPRLGDCYCQFSKNAVSVL